MEDESLSSVDQFLRDNGFSISESALELASLSEEDILDDELLLSDAEERQPSPVSSSSNQTPRFVLLEDEGLLMEQQERFSGDRMNEQQEDKVEDRTMLQDQQEQDSLDTSVFFGGAELSLSNGTPRVGSCEQETPLSLDSSSSSSSLLLDLQYGAGQDSTLLSSAYQENPQQKEMKSVAMASKASSGSLLPSVLPSSHSGSSVMSRRVLDDELNDAVKAPRSSAGVDRLSFSSKLSREEVLLHGRRTASDQGQHPHPLSTTLSTPRMQRALFTHDGDGARLIEKDVLGECAVRSMHGSGDQRRRWSQLRSKENVSVDEEVDEKEEDSDDKSTRYESAKTERNIKREDAVVIDEGAWNGLNDLLRKNGLPTVRFRDVGSEVLPDLESLFSVIHDFGAQLEHKNATIEDLVLASQRNSRVRSRREGELQTIEKKKEQTVQTLEKAKAEIQRLKALQKKENESAEFLSKKLKNSCLRLQQQLKVSEHRVKAKEIIVEKMQAKLQQRVDKETSNKMRDRRAFRNLQDRDPRRANPRDIQELEAIGVYEAQREQMQEEIDYLKSQVAALNSELRDKDNFIARQARTSLQNEPVVSGTQSRLRNRCQYESSSVASDEVMLEQLEAARRDQEVAAAKLRRREAVMVKKVAVMEQELLTARETIGELKEENANLSLETESRPSIRDYHLSQSRIRKLERQIMENKLALEEASDLNELRKYMGTKELMERDRLNHRLHLNRLNALPRETAVEVVKHVCRVLHLTDITLIAPSLDKMCSVVTAVPRMEKFIRDICEFVSLHLNDNTETTNISTARFELEQVIPTLQQWAMERRKLHDLEGFKTSIITELCKRTAELDILDDKENSSCSNPTLSRAVDIVSELVELEKSVMHHRDMYTQAAAEEERRPNVLINQIVRHFSHVFQVKDIEGVLPKINEIYLQVNEMKNFLHATLDVLHLRKDTSLVYCLNAIKERVQVGAVDATRKNPSGDGNSPNFVVEKYRSQPRPRGGNSGADLVGVQQVRQMSILIRELKRELGASTMDDILPRTRRLMELLSLSVHNAAPEDDDEYE